MHNPLPNILTARLKDILGASVFPDVLNAFGNPRRASFRINTLKATAGEALDELAERGIAIEKTDIPNAYTVHPDSLYSLRGSQAFYTGKIYCQSLSSMLSVLALNPKPGARVLDATAAPGGKTTQAAAAMECAGHVTAWEKHQVRYDKLLHTIRLQGAESITTAIKGDAIKLARESEPGLFDYIIADPTCSAEGRIRLDEERSYGFWKKDIVLQNAKAQLELLSNLVPLLAPRGVLLYSTCTLAPEENEGVVTSLMNEFDHIHIENMVLPTSVPTMPALHSFDGTSYHADINRCVRVLPTDSFEGFFLAKIVRTA